jgi:hypothetical protein
LQLYKRQTPLFLTFAHLKTKVQACLKGVIMGAKYKEFTGMDLPAIESTILENWQQSQAFEKSVSLRQSAKPFVFYEVRQAPMVCQVYTMLFQEH